MDYLDLRAALKSKGRAMEDVSGHHIFFIITIDDKEYKATKVSHSAKGQIPLPIASTIAKQMKLTNAQLRRFVACDLSRSDWFEIWKERET